MIQLAFLVLIFAVPKNVGYSEIAADAGLNNSISFNLLQKYNYGKAKVEDENNIIILSCIKITVIKFGTAKLSKYLVHILCYIYSKIVWLKK